MTHPRANFSYLLAGLILMLVASPIIEDLGRSLGRSDQSLIELVYVSTLLLGVWTLVRHEQRFRIGLLLTAITCGASAVAMLGGGDSYRLIAMGSMLAFFALATQLASHQVLNAGRVDRDTLMGAICIYLMLGLIFAILYTFTAMAIPAAFNGLDGAGINNHYASLVYFSFVTLTTLGYGDISPLHHIPRNLALFEAIIGQFYLAIMVAGLVGLRIANRPAPNPPGA